MKTIRRQELRTNELAEQIDQFSVWVRENFRRFATIVGIATAVVIAGFAYSNWRSNKLITGWQDLRDAADATDPKASIERFREVADRKLDPGLTAQAWLMAGSAAMQQLTPNASAGAAASNVNWSELATDAYTRIVQDHSNQANALGNALISLGVLAENRGDFEKARGFYKQVLDDDRFAGSPIRSQAEYRLEGINDWSKPVTFAPPAPTTAPVLAEQVPVAPTSVPGPEGAIELPVPKPGGSVTIPVTKESKPPAPVTPPPATQPGS